MSRQAPAKKRVDAQTVQAQSRRPLQKLLIGFAMIFFGASMLLPFKDDAAGLSSVISFLFFLNPLKWLFFLCSIAYIRLIFRLHDIHLPIFRTLVLFAFMLLAVGGLYVYHDNIKVGIGVIFWLASGYLLVAAAIRWRYPTRGLKSGFVALVLFTWLSVWVQGVYRNGIASNIWQTPTAEQPEAHETQTTEPMNENSKATPTSSSGSVAMIEQLSDLNPSNLIQVTRDFNIFNPWAEKDAPISCETLSKRAYPVLLPPRFLEDGYEWRNYQHDDGLCHQLMYVGMPSRHKNPDLFYKITQDRRSNIFLIMSNKANQSIYNQNFTMNRETNGLAASDYTKVLNEGFSHLVEDDSIPMADGEYVFNKAETPSQADVLSAGCELKPINGRFNTYQWGTGRINFRGQFILKPNTFCSSRYVGLVHLSPDMKALVKGKSNVLENRIHVKLFQANDLKPVSCGAITLPLSASEVQAWDSGQLHAENIQINPVQTTGCLNVRVQLSNGRTIQNNK